MVRQRLTAAGGVLLRNLQNSVPLPPHFAQDARALLLAAEPWCRRYQMGVITADDEYVRGLNRRYRRINRPTDVLSFPVYPVRGSLE